MNTADMLLRFLCLTGTVFALGVLGIGLGLAVMLATYYTLIML